MDEDIQADALAVEIPLPEVSIDAEMTEANAPQASPSKLLLYYWYYY